ncbi:phosphate-starvation-inducible PsiE family protein [Saccharopolyspora sp. K220]|uniref:phosphate-starvation-inducible PsiE family protein n=1 Tax=Saccharopolyspora soli TaxID=2926618 RepID=UPI001F55DCF3|nr:phosphate-starvation-inducible PsiE family protein [Saccharopolyspora soli]MCI2419313.1 phosphate-starvation-inducible PsiE family protein [Saccharopolyspora soli]
MANESDGWQDGGASSPRQPDPLRTGDRTALGALVLRLLLFGEYYLLYVISLVLLVLAAAILVVAVVSVVQSPAPWPEQFIGVIEELLLILIVLEIFVTVVHHLRGGHLQLEPFIVVGVIAIVRHILSIVIRLAVPGAAPVTHDQLVELAVSAGVAFVLVAALALARWSRPRASID